VEITAVRLLDDRGQERHVYVPGESLTFALALRAEHRVEDFVFGVGLFNADGVCVYGTNTHLEDYEALACEGTGEVRFVMPHLALVEGTYLLDVAVHRRDGTPYDYHRGLYSFRVKSRLKDVGLHRPAHRWEFAGGARLTAPPPRPELDLHDPATLDAEDARDGSPVTSSLESLLQERRAWKAAGRRVVFTNGCFDLLHPGHLRLLESARAEGDVLVVGLNSDASVRGTKGPGRPVLPEGERAEALLALEAVDRVVIYDDPTPRAVIAALLPEVLVKGADWEEDAIVGREEVEAAGGRVVRVELTPGHSTTALVGKIRGA
jgi:rfaE bifunctional protein nucleotidyltransferase chain/domain